METVGRSQKMPEAGTRNSNGRTPEEDELTSQQFLLANINKDMANISHNCATCQKACTQLKRTACSTHPTTNHVGARSMEYL